MMPMIGAYMGGNTSPIATGYGLFKGQWLTSDGLNIDSAIINLSGPENVSLNVDQNGYVSKVLKVGTYTATVTHEGEYSGDESKTVVVPNRDEIIVTWFASRKYKVSVVVSSPSNLQSATYTVKDDSDEVIYSGSSWSSSMTFQLYSGSYTLSLTYAGDTMTYAFDVGNSNKSLDITDRFCKISITQPIPSVVLGVTYNGVSVGTVNEFYVIKSNSSRTISYSGVPSYSGPSSSAVATVSSSNVVPSSDSISVSPIAVGTVVTISSAGTLKVPVSGNYHVLAIGGGSGGDYANRIGSDGYWRSGPGGGGGSGHVAEYTGQLEGDYEITIGAGGTAGRDRVKGGSGGPTSFGSVVSASGGDGGTNTGKGGAGGSGGGGGFQGNGGNGSYSGGGGPGGGYYDGDWIGGIGGTYGGRGGYYGGSGSAGTTDSDEFYSGVTASGGSDGSDSGSGEDKIYGGGGGGGGRNARGGNGGNTTSGGGGGGGGIAGGTGGAGPGYGGKGYGAGGGGGGRGGGGGGGGLSALSIASDGSSSGGGGAGAHGAIRIQWRG